MGKILHYDGRRCWNTIMFDDCSSISMSMSLWMQVATGWSSKYGISNYLIQTTLVPTSWFPAFIVRVTTLPPRFDHLIPYSLFVDVYLENRTAHNIHCVTFRLTLTSDHRVNSLFSKFLPHCKLAYRKKTLFS